jgi:hypothetical protein
VDSVGLPAGDSALVMILYFTRWRNERHSKFDRIPGHSGAVTDDGATSGSA